MAIIDLSKKIPDLMSRLSKKNNKRKDAEQQLIEKSNESIKSVLQNIIKLDLLALSEEDIKKMTDSIGEQIQNFQLRDKKSDEKIDSFERDEPFQLNLNILNINDESEYERKPPRRGNEFLCQIKLPRDMQKYLLDNWKSDVTLTNQPYKKIGDHQLWRCGSSIFVICDGTRETLMKIEEQMKNEQMIGWVKRNATQHQS